MMPFRRVKKNKATRCQWRVCAAAVAACGSSASWIRGTRTLFLGPRLLEGASACVQCFVRRETASVRSVVRLWREDAGPRHDQNLGLLLGSPTAGMSILRRRLLDFGRSTTQNTTDDLSLLGLTCVSHPGRLQYGGHAVVSSRLRLRPKKIPRLSDLSVLLPTLAGIPASVRFGSGRAGQGRAIPAARVSRSWSFCACVYRFHYRAFHMHSWLICLLE